MSSASAKPPTKPQTSPSAQGAQPTPAQHSGPGRRPADASTDKNRVWKPVIARLGEVEARVAKILSKSGIALPPDTATAIIVDAALKALGNGPSEAEIWEAVLASERTRLESIEKLRAGAST